MKEIKFRAWDKEKKQMLTAGFIMAPLLTGWVSFPYNTCELLEKYQDVVREHIGVIKNDWQDIVSYFTSSDYSLFDWANLYGIDNYEVMQYTGMKDKNGKEIYEGDIMQFIMKYAPYNGMEAFGVVTYESLETAFIIKPIKEGTAWDRKHFGIGTDDPLIVGNIYENPELLEVKS